MSKLSVIWVKCACGAPFAEATGALAQSFQKASPVGLMVYLLKDKAARGI